MTSLELRGICHLSYRVAIILIFADHLQGNGASDHRPFNCNLPSYASKEIFQLVEVATPLDLNVTVSRDVAWDARRRKQHQKLTSDRDGSRAVSSASAVIDSPEKSTEGDLFGIPAEWRAPRYLSGTIRANQEPGFSKHVDGFVRRPKDIRHVSKVDKRKDVSVSFGNLWSGYSIAHNGNLETQLEKLPQMRFNAHVCKHASKDDLIDTLLAELERQIVDLGAVQFVR